MPRFDFDTVISGAGVSMANPSALPSGDDLALATWESLFTDEPPEEELRTCVLGAFPSPAPAGGASGGLRLEYLMQVLSSTAAMPLEALTRVYEVMDVPQANYNHHALAALPSHRHYTLNMDTLLERAGLTDVVHLHGRWDQVEGIATTIGQYVRQLPPQLAANFRTDVAGRNVLVLGYSGRDVDVFPVVCGDPPARLTWLRRPGDALEPEVEDALARVNRDTSCKVEIVDEDLRVFLRSYGAGDGEPHLFDLAANRNAKKVLLPPSTRAAIAEVPLSKRALGAARVLFELGEFDRLDHLANLDPCSGGAGVHLRKVVARAERRRGHETKALTILLRPPPNVEGLRVWVYNGNEIANLVTRVGFPQIGALLDRRIDSVGRKRNDETGAKTAMQARVRLGQHASVRGDLGAARLLHESVVNHPELSSLLDPSGVVDATTWLLDVVKAQGDYLYAQELVGRMYSLAPYTNLSQRAYAYWQTGAVQHLLGETGAALTNLASARVLAAASRDTQAQAWVAATLSDAQRREDSRAAAETLEPWLRNSSVRYLARQYLLLQAAEQVRADGDLEAASNYAEGALDVRPPGLARMPRRSMNYLAARFVALMISAERNGATPRWVGEGLSLRDAYDAVDAEVARTQVNIVLHQIAGVPLSTTIEESDLWPVQRDMLTHDWNWRRPWPVIA